LHRDAKTAKKAAITINLDWRLKVARAMKKVTTERTIVNPNIDTQWFVNTLRNLGISMREYEKRHRAKRAVGAASRLFRGMRQFSSEDGKIFSQVTGVSFDEVMRKAGGVGEYEFYGLTDGDSTTGIIPVTGWIDAARGVHFKNIKGPRKVTLPLDMDKSTIALRYQTQGTNLDAMDGAVIYCQPLGPLAIQMLNRWCVVRLEKGGHVVRILKKGRSPRMFNLWNDADLQADVEVAAASAIEWARF
jgi:hypothetical protein